MKSNSKKNGPKIRSTRKKKKIMNEKMSKRRIQITDLQKQEIEKI